MQREELKQRIIGLIPENDLRGYVQAHDFPFSDGDLVKMAYDLSPTCEQRAELLTQCASALTYEASQFALRILSYLDRINVLFHEDSNCVYELKIKDTPDAYEERYLCGLYQAALDMIKWFCEEYNVTLTERSDISVCKRRIIREPAEHGEDYVAEVQLDSALNEVRYYSNESFSDQCPDECENDCTYCDAFSLCNYVKYPRILNDGDIVRFRNGFDVGYGIVLHCGGADTTDAYHTVDLSAGIFREKRFDELFDAHMHILPYNVNRINADELPDDLRQISAHLLAYLRSSGTL